MENDQDTDQDKICKKYVHMELLQVGANIENTTNIQNHSYLVMMAQPFEICPYH